MDDKTAFDVVIVGAGAIGLCCALSLVEAGKNVCLVDKNEPGAGASSGNAGVISPWSIVPQSTPGLWRKVPRWLLDPQGPLSIKPTHFPKLIPWIFRFLRDGTEERVRAKSDVMETLNQNNVDLYRRHLAGTGREHLVTDSYYVHAFRNDHAGILDTLQYALRLEKGADVEKISADDLRDLEPDLARDFQMAVLVKGQARAISPGAVCQALAEKFVRNGGTVVRQKVINLRKTDTNGWIVEAEGAALVADKIVVCAGAWSARLLRPLGFKIPLEAERGYHVEFEDAGVCLNNSVMDVDFGCVASSMSDGLRLAGTAEFAPLDTPPTPARIEALMKAAKNMLPDLNTADMTSWMGSRPSLPDSLPIIDEVTDNPGLFAAFGHCHYGLMMAPKTGEIIADLMTNKRTNTDLTPFRFDRF